MSKQTKNNSNKSKKLSSKNSNIANSLTIFSDYRHVGILSTLLAVCLLVLWSSCLLILDLDTCLSPCLLVDNNKNINKNCHCHSYYDYYYAFLLWSLVVLLLLLSPFSVFLFLHFQVVGFCYGLIGSSCCVLFGDFCFGFCFSLCAWAVALVVVAFLFYCYCCG